MNNDDLKQIKNDLKNIAKDLDYFLKNKLKTVSDLQAFEKRLKTATSGEVLGKAFDEWKSKSLTVLESMNRDRQSEFNRYVAEFVRGMQSSGTPTREFHGSWRVGAFMVEFKAEQATVQIAYNYQILIPWKPIGSAEDIQKVFDQGNKMLEEMTIPLDNLVSFFPEAIRMALLRANQDKKHTHTDVPIKDFYLETEIALFRSSKLNKGRSKIKELPLWAFLYNLDRYRNALRDVPIEKRLAFMSGSQHEISKNMGLVLNGLNALEDYKTFCFVKQA